MEQIKNAHWTRKYIDNSLIINMLICPSSFSQLNKILTNPFPDYQMITFNQTSDNLSSLLMKMNPLLSEDIKEKEINSIIQEDNFEQLKIKIINHLLDPNYRDRKGISLIEKCVFFFNRKNV